MYFTVNLAFVDYLEELNETIEMPIERNGQITGKHCLFPWNLFKITQVYYRPINLKGLCKPIPRK